ncbi:MAG: YidC/Oxa1 family insertase periplasmic-domain containing protein [Planctomycetota bacterium]|jgi:YidC/Oxa1 family membrane protein insertase
MRIALILVVAVYVLFCGWLVVASGLFDGSLQGRPDCILLQQTTDTETGEATVAPASDGEQLQAAEDIAFGADNAPAKTVILGAADPNTENANTGFRFQLQLSSKGAAIRRAIFSNGPDSRGRATGFDDRDHKDPQPLAIISPIPDRGGEILAMANKNFVFVEQGLQLPLNRLDWKSLDDETTVDTARFVAIIKNEDTGEPIVKLTKTYRISRESYLLEFDITIENLGDAEQKVRFNMSGPGGLGREGIRADNRKIVAGFRNSKNEILSTRLDWKDLIKGNPLKNPGGDFLWVAAVNKYFAAIVVPIPDGDRPWISDKRGRLYNPDGDTKAKSGDETLGLDMSIASNILAATGQAGSSKTYKFQMYLGPKDKSLFDKNEQYNNLGFSHTIDFMGCCCPAKIIKPLAFGILALMKGMYGFIPNYGVVIIVLVFFMRLCMHPITKKSQVSMSKMSQLAPKAEEIKKKYANNKAEMNKQMMALYREQGASPIMGFLPMMVQMPIWISLWSAVYASIDLRGAAFLPFWITDLSMPDALYRFGSPLVVPLLGWKIASVNLLPLMMGVAFYLQQQLMPTQASASTNPQMAQQQKMMKIMMPLLFPLMLYNAPSGVSLYIMASTFAGVFEQHVIRKHIREKEQAESQGMVAATSKTGGKVKKKKPKPFYRT